MLVTKLVTTTKPPAGAPTLPAMRAAHAADSVPTHASASRRLARPLDIERVYDPDREAMLAALRVVLDLPRQLPDRGQGGVR